MKKSEPLTLKGAMLRRELLRGPAQPVGTRLIELSMMTAEEWESASAAEISAWHRILEMDEEALDDALPQSDLTAIDSRYEIDVRDSGKTEFLSVVCDAEDEARYRQSDEQFRIRLAGVFDGLMGTDAELCDEVKEIRKLLMHSGALFLPSVFRDLPEFIGQGQLLVAERITSSGTELVGAVAFQILEVLAFNSKAGGTERRTVNFIPALAVRQAGQRRHIALRLCLEAMLRGTLRSLADARPLCVGTVGLVFDANSSAISWSTHLNEFSKRQCVRILSDRSKAAYADPALSGLRDRLFNARAFPEGHEPYHFVVADRLELMRAARLHSAASRSAWACETSESRVNVEYESIDPFIRDLKGLAGSISRKDDELWSRLGLTASTCEGPWHFEATREMSEPVSEATCYLEPGFLAAGNR